MIDFTTNSLPGQMSPLGSHCLAWSLHASSRFL